MANQTTENFSQDGAASSAHSRLAAEAKAMAPSRRPYQPPPPQDITTPFATHTSALPPGHLIKDPYFTLFEAVGALEIMDPKMDSGFIPADDSFEADFDANAGLEAGEVLWVMDQILCLEVEWLEGYPLSQTVFSSLHVDALLDPSWEGRGVGLPSGIGDEGRSVEDVLTRKVLRAYCVAVVKCLELSIALVQGQNFYEEEDFVTHLFGRELLPKVSVDDAIRLLEEAKTCVDGSDAVSAELRGALWERLFLREQMVDALGGGSQEWTHILDILEVIETHHSLASPIPDAFSSKVQRQLATSTPPRPMLNVTWDDAMNKWRRLVTDALEAYRLASPAIISDPQCLQQAVWSFAYRNPPPSTLPRAILQEQLFHEQGPVATGVGHYELFLSDLRNHVLADDSLIDPASFQVELPTDPRHMRSRLLEQFIEKAFDEYLNLYRMVCQNRCRIRRLFTQAIGIWETLENEARVLDDAIANVPAKGMTNTPKDFRPLSSWAKHYKLKIIMWSIQLGFETEIHMDDELGSMYWFLNQTVATQSHHLDQLDWRLKDRMIGKKASKATAEWNASLAYLSSTSVWVSVTEAISQALSTFYLHLQALGIIASPKRDFAQQQLFYEARMKPYLSVSNDRIPSASDFSEVQRETRRLTTDEVCEDIDTSMKEARSHLVELKKISPIDGKFVGTEKHTLKEIKALETVCVAIAVNASQLVRLRKEHGVESLREKVECTMERRWHEWWVVPVLKKKK